MGWGKVAEDLKKNGFTTNDKVGEAVRRVTDAHRELVAKNEKATAEKLEKKTEKVERMGKPERLERIERPERPGNIPGCALRSSARSSTCAGTR